MISLADLKQEDKVNIEEVYGIIYRIYCKPEKKSYIGQTLSHNLVNNKWYKFGLNGRINRHFNLSIVENKNTKLTEVLRKYPKDEFDVCLEEKIPGNKINLLNKIESVYMTKYDTLNNGYNFVKMSTSISKSKQKLIDHYGLSVEEEKYVDDTRQRRAKDITIGGRVTKNAERISFFKDKEIEKVIITFVGSALRVLVCCKGMKDKYRFILGHDKEKAMELANGLSSNIEIKGLARDFLHDKSLKESYKHQDRLDSLLKEENFTSVKGKFYFHKRFQGYTYILFFYGKKKNRVVIKDKVSFGGKHDTNETIYKDANIFLNKFLEKIQVDEISLQSPESITQNQCLQQVAAE